MLLVLSSWLSIVPKSDESNYTSKELNKPSTALNRIGISIFTFVDSTKSFNSISREMNIILYSVSTETKQFGCFEKYYIRNRCKLRKIFY